jgi:hypothetical protein
MEKWRWYGTIGRRGRSYTHTRRRQQTRNSRTGRWKEVRSDKGFVRMSGRKGCYVRNITNGVRGFSCKSVLGVRDSSQPHVSAVDGWIFGLHASTGIYLRIMNGINSVP